MRKRLTIIFLSVAVLSGLFYLMIIDSKGKIKSSYVGNYESLAPTLIEKAKFALVNTECFSSGRKLKLLVDSSFILSDDTSILTGKWHQDIDKINLHFLAKKYIAVNSNNKLGKLRVPPNDCSLKCSSSDLYMFFTDSTIKCAELFKAMP